MRSHDTRLLTLTGPGGTGKTRLSLQLAAEMSDEFEDGVFFVPLDSIVGSGARGTGDRLRTRARAASGPTAPLDAVLEFLGEKRVLLLLDNFEQVVDAARAVNRLMREAPNVKVLVTTRIVLRVYGERELPGAAARACRRPIRAG